jgi:pimeloyl-ACP methyl ester carboxylesterase
VTKRRPGGTFRECVAAALSERFWILRFDCLIYRHDPPPTGADAMAGEVSDVLAIASAVDGPLLLVGHSSGAVVAMQSALAAPSRFAGMLLYEPPVAVTGPLGGDALRRARAALDAGDLPVLLLGGARSPARLRAGLDALANVLPQLDSVVILAKQGHLATLRAPGQVAAVIASFADRVLQRKSSQFA